jgi:peptide/nickel transport system substrate-binding protein
MYYYLGFDLTNPLFADKNVRKAINYSIDRKKLVRAVLNDTAVVATGPIPLASWAYTDKVIKYDYDPDKAVKLLNASGWKKGRSGYLEKDGRIFEFQLDYPLGRSEFQKSAVIINGYLSEIGIKSVLRGVEFNVLLRKCYPGKFEAVLLDWIENYDPDCFVEWDSSQTGNKGMNFMSYINPVTDEILMKARKTLDIQKRKYLYHKFQKIIADDSPYVFLWYPSNIYAFNKRIMGISRPNPVGIFLNPERLYIK